MTIAAKTSKPPRACQGCCRSVIIIRLHCHWMIMWWITDALSVMFDTMAIHTTAIEYRLSITKGSNAITHGTVSYTLGKNIAKHGFAKKRTAPARF